jgi:hypothetical protein
VYFSALPITLVNILVHAPGCAWASQLLRELIFSVRATFFVAALPADLAGFLSEAR